MLRALWVLGPALAFILIDQLGAITKPPAVGRSRDQEVTIDLGDGVRMDFVLVPAGRFKMGSPAEEKERQENELQHEVELSRSFYMGKYEVTQEQYQQLMGNNPSYFSADGEGKTTVAGLVTKKFPVEQVSWNDAMDFCRKLNNKRDGRSYRLPTEAEWEYACRGGQRESLPFGVGSGKQMSSRIANFDGNTPYDDEKGPYLDRPCDVGLYRPNGYGVYDMGGNAGEWCLEWFENDYYKDSPKRDPQGPAQREGNNLRSRRGGSWYGLPAYCRSASRTGVRIDERNRYDGFRVIFTTP